MGVPSYGILSETFLQNIEASHITQQTKQCMIINCLYDVDNILLIFDSNHTKHTSHSHRLYPHIPELTFHRTIRTKQYNKLSRYFHTKNCTQYKNNHLQTTHVYRYYHSLLFQLSQYAAITHLYNRPRTYQLCKEDYNQEKTSSITSYTTMSSCSNHAKFQNRNKTRQETHKYKYPPPPPKELHLLTSASQPHSSLKYLNTRI